MSFVNLASLDEAARPTANYRERTIETLKAKDAAVLASAGSDPAAKQLAMQGVNVVDVTSTSALEESEATAMIEAGGPRPIRAVYTGMPPVAAAVSRELMATLKEAALIALPGLALAMMFVVRNPIGGLASLLPIGFPIVIGLGLLGWIGVDIDVAILLAAGLAVGIALDGAVNYSAWFRRAAATGLFRQEAARLAYARVAPAMLETLLVGGVGLVPLAASGIASVQLQGLTAAGIMAIAMAGNLVLLPALVTSPLGQFFGAAAHATRKEISETPAPIEPPRPHEPRVGRKDVAAAAGPAAPHHNRPIIAVDDGFQAVDGPHAALQAKLQRLRRSTGD
jgi:predicted RND superfamily exporter protein